MNRPETSEYHEVDPLKKWEREVKTTLSEGEYPFGTAGDLSEDQLLKAGIIDRIKTQFLEKTDDILRVECLKAPGMPLEFSRIPLMAFRSSSLLPLDAENIAAQKPYLLKVVTSQGVCPNGRRGTTIPRKSEDSLSYDFFPGITS